MSRIANILAAVVTHLNAGSYSQSFTAARAYTTRVDVADAGALQVLVVPRSRATVTATRDNAAEDPAVDIGIIAKLANYTTAAAELAEIDALLLLVEEIGDGFQRQALATDPPAAFLSLANVPIYDQALLKESRVFFSVITLTFRQYV
jgi:hypothetical protein